MVLLLVVPIGDGKKVITCITTTVDQLLVTILTRDLIVKSVVVDLRVSTAVAI
jgi:hypothetical protein